MHCLNVRKHNKHCLPDYVYLTQRNADKSCISEAKISECFVYNIWPAHFDTGTFTSSLNPEIISLDSFDSACTVWSAGLSKKHKDRIQPAQNKLISYIKW